MVLLGTNLEMNTEWCINVIIQMAVVEKKKNKKKKNHVVNTMLPCCRFPAGDELGFMC